MNKLLTTPSRQHRGGRTTPDRLSTQHLEEAHAAEAMDSIATQMTTSFGKSRSYWAAHLGEDD